MELTCKVRHLILKNQMVYAVPDKSGQALTGPCNI
jgi:hypothetical protein